MKNILKIIALISLIIIINSCGIKDSRDYISIEGKWGFKLDSLNLGESDKWFMTGFFDSEQFVNLPGTTDTNKKGYLNISSKETTHLSREYKYVGKAWYQKKINIPEGWRNKKISLFLERTKPTKIWVGDKFIGYNTNISTPHIFDLTDYLKPGDNIITIMVDNKGAVPPQILDNSHAYTESTQTNWNGIIGKMYLESYPLYSIGRVDVYPNIKDKKAKVMVRINGDSPLPEFAKIKATANSFNTDKKHNIEFREEVKISNNIASFEINLGDDMLLWSEFDPALYNLTIETGINNYYDVKSINFGAREFSKKGTQFVINEKTIFLRGKHDACVFPLTGHVAMNVDQWKDYFRKAKAYGINHYRFHSWCPPEACFIAADEEGIYLQPELPFWGSVDSEDSMLINFLFNEGINVHETYGNHPSFVLFAIGNELSGDRTPMISLIETFRKVDNRHLFATGSNNYLGYNGPAKGDDFFVTCRVPGDNSLSTHARASFSFADATEGGYLNNTYPNTCNNLESAVDKCDVPIISHETGQFQTYPDYNQIKKYTGVLKPNNLEIFKQRLCNAGMEDQAHDFFMASGKWSMQLYKAEIEMDLRSKGLAGFQLLDIQDYPGQGSAYIGVLDAFMDSKGLISEEEWRMSCNDIVLLMSTDKLCYSNDELFSAQLMISNYSEKSINEDILNWCLYDENRTVLDNGSYEINAEQGELSDVGDLKLMLNDIDKACKLTLELNIENTEIKNIYDIWVYPSSNNKISISDNITIKENIDNSFISDLNKGKSILFIPKSNNVKNNSVGGLFQTDYWNYRMFKHISESNSRPVSPGTLGLLMNPDHPVFDQFPTQSHTSWQWYDAVKNSYPLILDNLPKEYKPIVQVIDNIERNHKLGLLMEFNVGNGKLLVLMSDIYKYQDKPEGRQLLKSIINYMSSDKFKPDFNLSELQLKSLFTERVEIKNIKELKNISYE